MVESWDPVGWGALDAASECSHCRVKLGVESASMTTIQPDREYNTQLSCR